MAVSIQAVLDWVQPHFKCPLRINYYDDSIYALIGRHHRIVLNRGEICDNIDSKDALTTLVKSKIAEFADLNGGH